MTIGAVCLALIAAMLVCVFGGWISDWKEKIAGYRTACELEARLDVAKTEIVALGAKLAERDAAIKGLNAEIDALKKAHPFRGPNVADIRKK